MLNIKHVVDRGLGKGQHPWPGHPNMKVTREKKVERQPVPRVLIIHRIEDDMVHQVHGRYGRKQVVHVWSDGSPDDSTRTTSGTLTAGEPAIPAIRYVVLLRHEFPAADHENPTLFSRNEKYLARIVPQPHEEAEVWWLQSYTFLATYEDIQTASSTNSVKRPRKSSYVLGYTPK